jgi:hypothetical protein
MVHIYIYNFMQNLLFMQLHIPYAKVNFIIE